MINVNYVFDLSLTFIYGFGCFFIDWFCRVFGFDFYLSLVNNPVVALRFVLVLLSSFTILSSLFYLELAHSFLLPVVGGLKASNRKVS